MPIKAVSPSIMGIAAIPVMVILFFRYHAFLHFLGLRPGLPQDFSDPLGFALTLPFSLVLVREAFHYLDIPVRTCSVERPAFGIGSLMADR
jgi:hypothetical protein